MWTVVDDDVILPHNLARHALGDDDIGRNKAEALADTVRRLLNSETAAEGIPCDLLRPGDLADAIDAAFAECQLVVDCSRRRPSGVNWRTERTRHHGSAPSSPQVVRI